MTSQKPQLLPLSRPESLESSQIPTCSMATRNRRKSSIDRASVQSILTSGESHHAAAPPSPHVGVSSNKEFFAMDPPPRPAIVKHTRAMSYTPRKPNRLSLSFPVAPSATSNDSARPTPTSSNAPSFPATPAEVAPVSSPTDTNSFLVALAGQERRVLELKEELEKAEADLGHLKKQWARYEASKKRAEIRHSEPLRPLHTAMTEGESSNEEGSVTRQSAEMDRRKALLSNIHKESRRKVLSGGHTRTLSLLSPDRASYGQPFPFPPVQESGSESDASSIPKSTTMPDTSRISKVSSNRARHSYQGGVTNNAKQIAEDVKAGLWTFLEDLRQATVGDEAVNGTTNRASLDPTKDPKRKTSKNSLLSNERGRHGSSPKASDTSTRTWETLTGSNPALLDAAGTMWEEMDQSRPALKSLTPLKQKPAAKTFSTTPLVDDIDDDWSNWDSPTPKSPRWSGSTELTDPATPAHSNGADRSVK